MTNVTLSKVVVESHRPNKESKVGLEYMEMDRYVRKGRLWEKYLSARFKKVVVPEGRMCCNLITELQCKIFSPCQMWNHT